MTGAMYAAIAGLRTHMQNLNVIGNNIANVNTYGYKSARSVFKTAIYTTLQGGSDGTTVMSGNNPSQIGYGANMGSVGIDMSTGNYAITGRSMDWMLDGDGFFIMGDKTMAGKFTGGGTDSTVLNGMNLTRVGNFEFGPDGYLGKDDDGNCVYGFVVTGIDEKTGKPIYSDQLVPIRLPCITTEQAKGADGTLLTDDEGNPIMVAKVEYSKVPGEGQHLEDPGLPKTTGTGTDAVTKPGLPYATFQGITIDRTTGIITGTCYETGELVTIGIVAVGTVRNPNGVTNISNNYYQAGPGSGGLSVNLLGGAANTIFNKAEGEVVYMNNSLRATAGDGTPPAEGEDTAIADVQRILTGGKTGILSNGLEMSKTDLAQEISQMILTQRGYQANTRVITVTDSMLEELVNMKR